VWVDTVADPILMTVGQDQAVPDFAFGVLRGVTLGQEVERDGPDPVTDRVSVWRHLERHEPGPYPDGVRFEEVSLSYPCEWRSRADAPRLPKRLFP
jgi:hypothetical protein